MAVHHDLHLYEDVMLLCLNDYKGTTQAGGMYGLALGGAVFGELLLLGKARLVEGHKKRTMTELVHSTGVGDSIIDEGLTLMRVAPRRSSPEGWVGKFAMLKKLKHRAAESLVRRGILRAAEDKLLLIFTRKIYPEVDHEPEHRIIKTMRQAILEDGEVDARTRTLIAICGACYMLEPLFGKKELKPRQARIDELAKGDPAGKGIRSITAGNLAIL